MRAPLLICSLALALTVSGAATLTPTDQGFSIQAAGYEAAVGKDGSLTSLKVVGQEFFFTQGNFPRGGYLYQDGIHQAQTTTPVGDKACEADTDLAHWRYTFDDTKITLDLQNKSPKNLQYVIVFDPALQAMSDDRGRFRKVPANGAWATTTWYRSPAKLKISGGMAQWGPWGAGKHQVLTATVPPGKTWTLVMEAGMADAAEQQRAQETCERVLLPPTDPAGPMWDLQRFSAAPPTYPAEGFAEAGVRALFFEGPPYDGRPTRVFAWIGFPPGMKPGEKVPGMVLVHGGGGTAFASWVKLWTSRGYAAISMDTCGAVPKGTYGSWDRHEWSGPPGWGGYGQIDEPREDQWAFHAVAAALLGHSLLRAQPQVDPQRIGLTGISWGGYLTCIIAGVDPRYQFAAPVYGCGFTNEHSFAAQVNNLGPERAARWMRWWDPSAYLADVKFPMLWVTGTNDFAYTFNALQKSYRLPKTPRTLAIRLRMPHGHGAAGEAPEEIRVFADSVLKGGKPMAKITSQGRDGMSVWATFEAPVPIVKTELLYTKDRGTWPERKWEAAPAACAAGKVTATLPEGVTVYYLNLYDERNCAVSTEHEELAP
jgi:dienelactone hydrolase